MIRLFAIRFAKVFYLVGRALTGLTGIAFLLRRYYWKALVREAPALGLEHVPSDFYYRFGELRGKFNGREIRVEIENEGPGAGVRITTNIPGLAVELLGRRPVVRPEEGWIDFRSGNPVFNILYGTKRRSTAVTDRQSQAMAQAIVPFYLKWGLFLKMDVGSNGLDLGSGKLAVWLNVGGSFTPYVRPVMLARLLPDVVALAEQIEGGSSQI